MPRVDYGDTVDLFNGEPVDLNGRDVPAVTDPGMLATIGAAFREGNIVGSFLANETDGLNPYEREDGFDPIKEVTGTKYESRINDAAGIFNRPYFEAWKRQVDREEEDRRTLNASPWIGTAASVAAGILDLPTLIPGGAVVRGARGGYSILRSGASVAAAGAVGAGVSEIGLQSTQQTRTATDSAINIGAGAVFGGLLGAGVGGLMSRLEQRAAVNALSRSLSEVRAGTSLTPVADEVEAVLNTGRAQMADSSAGAARVVGESIEDLSIAGRGAEAVLNVTGGWAPALRAMTSPSRIYRSVAGGLFENAAYTRMNVQGRTLGASVETRQKEWARGALANVLEEQNTLYVQARKEGLSLTRTEFNEAVARAMRRGDAGQEPAVTRAAQSLRAKLFDPLKNEAIELGLLPKDVQVTEAESYLSRVWNPRKIEGQEQRFRKVVGDHVRGQVEREVKRLTERRDHSLSRINAEIADLEMPADQRAEMLRRLPEQLADLRQRNARFDPVDERLTDLRRRQAAARDASDRRQAEALTKEIDQVTADAGRDYADYRSARTVLQTRIARLRNNVVGREDQVAALQARIADIEASNVERLRRLHRSLAIIDEDIENAGPEVWTDKLAKARTQFADVLERSTKAQDRLAQANARDIERVEAGRATEDPAVVDQRIAERQLRFDAAETRRLEEMATKAARIAELEEVDPEAAVAELRSLIETRINDAASLVQRETAKMVELARRADAASPERATARIDALRAKMDDIDRAYADRVEVDLDSENGFQTYVDEVVDGIFKTLTGRNATSVPRDIVPAARGPLKERTFHIPDRLVEDFLENDVEMIARRYARIMGADVELQRRYGSTTLVDQITEIQNDYQALRENVQADTSLSETTRAKRVEQLNGREKADVRDLQAMRDMIRGTYLAQENSGNVARILRVAGTFNYLRTMGGVTVSSLTDAVRPAMVHGFRAYMQDGLAPLIRNMKAVKMSAREAKLAGAITERALQSRVATLAELHDPYSASSPFERFLDNVAHKFTRLTGLDLFTDVMKTQASMMTQNRILRNVQRGASELKDRERAYMAYLGLDAGMSERVGRQFAEHGETIDGILVANTDDWTDANARSAYYAAVNKDVDSIIVTKGIADTPLFAQTPTGRAMLQFKTFALASNQRVLMRGLQENPSRMIAGIGGMAAMGAFIYWLKQLEAGKEPSNNVGTWIAEGLDRSGIFSIGFEINNAIEKAGGPGVYSLLAMAGKAADPSADMKEPASRFATRSVVEGFLGPTVGLANDVVNTAAIPLRAAGAAVGGEEQDIAPSDIATLRRLAPFASLPYWRWLIDGGFGFERGAVPMLKEAVQ